jgi:hypothetical protein
VTGCITGKPNAYRVASLPSPALGECCHSPLAACGVTVGWRAIFMVPERERPHPGRADRRCIGLDDAADNFAVRQRVVKRTLIKRAAASSVASAVTCRHRGRQCSSSHRRCRRQNPPSLARVQRLSCPTPWEDRRYLRRIDQLHRALGRIERDLEQSTSRCTHDRESAGRTGSPPITLN